jgi:hypothetical protein
MWTVDFISQPDDHHPISSGSDAGFFLRPPASKAHVQLAKHDAEQLAQLQW